VISMTQKPEPLKNKMKTMIGARTLPEFNFFFADDVKSAVQGLIEDVENCMWLQALEKTYEGVYKLQPRKHIQDLIKKWFPDAVKE